MSMLTISSLPSVKLSSQSIPFHRTAPSPPPNSIQFRNFSPSISLLKNKLGLFRFVTNRNLGFVVKSSSGNGGEEAKISSSSSMDVVSEAEREARGDNTMPERFRYLAKEAPDPPLRWPYFVVLAFGVYAWRAVLWELNHYKKAAMWVLNCLLYVPKLVLAMAYISIGDPLTSIIRAIETTLYAIRAFYSQIVAYAPIPELLTIIFLSSAVLAIGEVAAPDSVESQWHLLTIAGLIGYFAVSGVIGDLLFWTLLFGLFSYSRFVKKKDYASSALPVAAMLAGVGEPWVRVVVIGSYLALAIVQYSKKQPEEGSTEGFVTATEGRRVPIPLLCAALAVGIRIAARWAGYRHLTWMVV